MTGIVAQISSHSPAEILGLSILNILEAFVSEFRMEERIEAGLTTELEEGEVPEAHLLITGDVGDDGSVDSGKFCDGEFKVVAGKPAGGDEDDLEAALLAALDELDDDIGDDGDEPLFSCDNGEDNVADSIEAPKQKVQNSGPSILAKKPRKRQKYGEKGRKNPKVSKMAKKKAKEVCNAPDGPIKTPAEKFCFGAAHLKFRSRLSHNQKEHKETGQSVPTGQTNHISQVEDGQHAETKSLCEIDLGDENGKLVANNTSKEIDRRAKLPENSTASREIEKRLDEIKVLSISASPGEKAKLDGEAWSLILQKQGLQKKIAGRGKKAELGMYMHFLACLRCDSHTLLAKLQIAMLRTCNGEHSSLTRFIARIGHNIPAPPPDDLTKPKRDIKPKWEPKKESPAQKRKRIREEKMNDWDTESYMGAARPAKTVSPPVHTHSSSVDFSLGFTSCP